MSPSLAYAAPESTQNETRYCHSGQEGGNVSIQSNTCLPNPILLHKVSLTPTTNEKASDLPSISAGACDPPHEWPYHRGPSGLNTVYTGTAAQLHHHLRHNPALVPSHRALNIYSTSCYITSL